MKNWIDVWTDNYEQKSSIAKWVLSSTKDTYKGDVYVPWGNMLHALYALDDSAEVLKIQNEQGGFVHTDGMRLHTEADGKVTTSTVVSHMVMVKVRFMNKWFTEVYPIQEKDYSASKVYDQNKVNKSLQRALARCISFATGVAWHLYENSSGQFEDDGVAPQQTKPATPPPALKTTTKVLPPITQVANEVLSGSVIELVDFIKDNSDNVKVLALVEKFNTILSSKYTFEEKPLIIDAINDTKELLKDKLETVANPNTMLEALKKVAK